MKCKNVEIKMVFGKFTVNVAKSANTGKPSVWKADLLEYP